MIEVKNLSKKTGNENILNNVNFKLPKNKITGIISLNSKESEMLLK